MALFPLIGIAAAPAPAPHQSLSLGLVLLAALVLVLVLFVAGIALLTRARHLRSKDDGSHVPEPDSETDAWREAGRRMRVDGDQGGGD